MFLFSTIKSAQRKTGQTITFKLFDVYIAFERKEEIFCIFTRGGQFVLSSDRKILRKK